MTLRKVKWFLGGGVLAVVILGAAFVALHWGIERGKLEIAEYESKRAISGKQRIVVYLPPNYPQDAPYPVLYLLHGAGDDEDSWVKECGADAILDRLYAEKKIAPMIVVMPNAQGRGNGFEQDLLEDVIPYIESHYAVQRDGRRRAIVGPSLGGWQALKIGLAHSDRFGWVGGFAAALRNILPEDYNGRLELLWLSCGDRDHLRGLNEELHKMLEEKKIAHVWRVRPGEHEWAVWKNDLREFLPLLFRERENK